MTRDRTALKAALLATTAVAIALPAVAQDAPAPTRSGGLEKIVVTTQKREESVLDVPIAITALGEQRLDELQVTDFNDFIKYLPSVSYQTFAPGITSVYFRGVVSGGDGNHSASLPSVGVYLDEQPITTILGTIDVHVYDINRVEAVAGPQGTLYGASAQSGVLRIITNKPEIGEFSAAYDLEGNYIEDGEAGYVAQGFANIPLGDRAAVRLVGWNKRDGGFIDNVAGTLDYPSFGIDDNAELVEENFNAVDTFGARAALRIDLNENWTATPSVMGQIQEYEGVFAYDPGKGDLKISRFNPDTSEDRWGQAGLTVEGKLSNFDLLYSGNYLERKIDTENDYSDYSYYYDVLYGYGAYFYDDNGDQINPNQYFLGEDKYRKASHEIRLSSPSDKRLRFVVGAFANYQEHNIQQRYTVDDLGSAISVSGWEDTIWLTLQQRVDRDYAVFGDAQFDLTDKLTLIGGIRGFKAENSLRGFFGYSDGFSSRTGEAACFGPAIVKDSPCTNLDRVVEEEGETYRLGAQYRLTEDKMIYATYATGFRPGGVNRRGTLPPYLSDELVSYELGWKTTWANGSFQWNGAIFHQEWTDFQFGLLGQNGLTEIQNAANAEIPGIEMDFAWAATDALTLTAAGSWVDAELTDNFCGFVDANLQPETDCPQAVDDPATDGDETADPQAPAGTRLPVVADFKGSLTARYEFPFMGYDAHLQGGVSYQGESSTDLRVLENSIAGDAQAYTIADIAAGIESERWRLEFFVQNLTDERAEIARTNACAPTVCGRTFIQVNQPRTIGVRFGQSF